MELSSQNTDIFKILCETKNSIFQTIQIVIRYRLVTFYGDLFYNAHLCSHFWIQINTDLSAFVK